jgi:hypothetical protein
VAPATVVKLGLVALAGCGRIGFAPWSDASSDAAAACPSTAILCEDFETGDLSRWTQSVILPGCMAMVDTARPHGGAYALEGVVPAGSPPGDYAIACDEIAPIGTGTFAMREWMNGAQTLIDFASPMQVLNEPACGGSQQHYILVACNSSGDWELSEAYPTLTEQPSATACPAPGSWTCVELDYAFGAPNHIQLFVDDALVIDAVPTSPIAAVSQLAVGAANAQPNGAHIFVDDIVVDTQHIGCR